MVARRPGAPLTKLIESLERHATWKIGALAVGVMVWSNVVLGVYALPYIEATRPEALDDGYLVMADLEPLRSAEEVYAIFALYTPDILGFVQLLYVVDFVTPLAFAVCLYSLFGAMLRYVEVREGAWRAAWFFPFAALPFDYAENALNLFLIDQYQDGRVFPALASVAGVVTAAKFVALACTGLTMVALLLRTATTFIGRRAASRRER